MSDTDLSLPHTFRPSLLAQPAAGRGARTSSSQQKTTLSTTFILMHIDLGRNQMPFVTGYVPGGFDMFHIGHLNILRASRERCDRLVVGVATDESLTAMKGRPPVIPHAERMEIVSQFRFVDEVIPDVSQDKRVAWRSHPFNVLFKGTDWQGTPKGYRLERELGQVGASVIYLPYTPSTSSTMLRAFLMSTST